MEKQLEIWKNSGKQLFLVVQEGSFTYSIKGFIKDFSENELILETNGLIQIINRKFIIKIKEVSHGQY